jgi:hypothetical protein
MLWLAKGFAFLLSYPFLSQAQNHHNFVCNHEADAFMVFDLAHC